MIGKVLKAWLELGRVSNLPTVWSNVVHGLAVGFFVAIYGPFRKAYPDRVPPIDWNDLGRLLDQGFLLIVGMSLLYIGGMVFNDACDAATDQQERPHRPIPSGRVTRREAFIGTVVLFGLGWACTLLYHPTVSLWAGVLIAAIVGYNLLHRWRWAGLALMPSCRGLVVWLSAMAFVANAELDPDLGRVLIGVLAISVYTLGVTLAAWGEALPGADKLASWVGVMIAGMAFVDALLVGLLGFWPMSVFCVGCGLLSLVGQRWIKGS